MKRRRKRALSAFACAVLLLCLPLRAYAIAFDGTVDPAEWFEYPAMELFREPSMCAVTNATVRFAVQPAQSRVIFGFTAVAPGMETGSPVGAAFLLGGREIGRWQHGLGGGFDADNYNLCGLAWFPADIANRGCTFEIELGCKTETALYALRDLSVKLFDPQGNPSRPVSCPVVTAEPVTTTKATTTEKTTTTKAPTTEKPTTTKATTTLPAYTTAPPAYAPVPQATANRASSATQAPAPSTAVSQAPPGTSRTEIVWYTEVYTAAPGITVDANGLPIWTYIPGETSQAQALPTLANPAQQASQPASRNAPALYTASGLLAVLGVVLIVFWLRAQKKSANPEPEAEEPT